MSSKKRLQQAARAFRVSNHDLYVKHAKMCSMIANCLKFGKPMPYEHAV